MDHEDADLLQGRCGPCAQRGVAGRRRHLAGRPQDLLARIGIGIVDVVAHDLGIGLQPDPGPLGGGAATRGEGGVKRAEHPRRLLGRPDEHARIQAAAGLDHARMGIALGRLTPGIDIGPGVDLVQHRAVGVLHLQQPLQPPAGLLQQVGQAGIEGRNRQRQRAGAGGAQFVQPHHLADADRRHMGPLAVVAGVVPATPQIARLTVHNEGGFVEMAGLVANAGDGIVDRHAGADQEEGAGGVADQRPVQVVSHAERRGGLVADPHAIATGRGQGREVARPHMFAGGHGQVVDPGVQLPR